jgi:LysR family hydrogen peroxide-inducible transcriptional activator
MQMVANGYGITPVPKVAVDVEVRDEQVKLLRFMAPEPGRAWRRTSPRKTDFLALGQLISESLGFVAWSADVPPALQKKA